uniref:Uncharacterized protein n=1 Tax=Tanacetum cinerariifolium TaxID=118510 RepID=A0A699GST7_TANCI|nr:hypothetical protein [Tanacetum cinerariifolium]
MTIDQQVALDKAFVPHASRLRIRKSNFRLRLDITSKESTLQLVYDVLRLTPFYKASLFTADVPEIYMHEFWAPHHSVRFKIDNKKRIVNLEYFREMLHICPRLPCQIFDELSFEEEILAFLRFLRHGGEIRKLTNVNINKLHQPWRSFTAVINECLNFVYQVEHKDAKKSNEMYYPRFTKVIIHYFMTKDPSIPRRNKVNWHYVIDDQMFITIKLVSRHQNTQQFGVMLPVELTNEDIKNSEAYKKYYAIASGAAPPKTKAIKGKQPAKSSKAKGLTVLSEVAMTEAEQMRLATKRSLQQTHISQASSFGADEGTGIIPWVPNVPTDESDEEISWKSSNEDDDDDVDERSDDQDNDDDQDDDDQDDDDQDDNNDDQDTDNDSDDFVHPKLSIHKEEAKDEEIFDPIVQTLENSNDEGNDDASLGLNVSGEEGHDAEDDDDELYRDININLEGRDVQMIDVHTTQEFKDTHVNLTPINHDVAPLTLTAPTFTPPTIPTTSQIPQATTPPKTTPNTFLQDLLKFGSLFGFDHRLKTLEANFSKFMQTNQFAGVISSILGIVERYMDQRMNKAVKIIKEQVKEKVKTSYAVAADLSKMELKKILIEKMESNKDTVTLKRRHNDADKDEEPSARSDQGSKRRREGKEPESTSAPKEEATKTTGKSTQGSKSHKRTTSEFAPAEEPMQTTQDLEEPSHQEFETGAADDQPVTEASQHPEWFQQQKKPPTPNHTLTPELLAGLTYELMKGSCKSQVELEFFLEEPLPLIPNSRGRCVIPFDHFINNDLEYLCGVASSRKYTTSVTKTKAVDYGHIRWIEDLVPHTMWSQKPVGYDKYSLWEISHWGRKCQQFDGFTFNKESARDVYSKGRIIAVTELQIIEWQDYKHLDWITMRRDDDKIYKFKEVDFKRLRIQDIKDMLLLLVQEKLKNLTVEERFAFNVSLRMFTRSIVLQWRMEYLQLDKQNMLMRIDELHKFSDGMLNDVRTALDDRLKGIQMKYLPQVIWRKSDKERSAAMIQAIDKMLKTRRIMRSLEKFVGERLYEGDFRMLQRTI